MRRCEGKPYESSLTCFVNRDLYLAAVFLWIKPLLTALSINDTVGVKSSPLCFLSLADNADLSFLI